jgi:hypothetical protein
VGIVGFFLVVTGVIMNVLTLRRANRARIAALDVMRALPWMLSVAIIGIGILLLTLAH